MHHRTGNPNIVAGWSASRRTGRVAGPRAGSTIRAVTTVSSGLTAADVRTVVERFREVLRAYQTELNRLNVYPVPDGDTGTNMALTVESVARELDDVGPEASMATVCQAIAHGSLMGARGNSGVILSQILRGLAGTFSTTTPVDTDAVVTGLRQAADAAYQAVMRPVEGTILTVAREAAEVAEAALAESRDLVSVLGQAAAGAHASVARTPELLPALKHAGVVDAGGLGFALFLDTWVEVCGGAPVPEPEPSTDDSPVMGPDPATRGAHATTSDDVANQRFEVMYLLEAKDHTIAAFRDAWDALGDSIVVVGGDGLWNCHVHTNDIGGAVEAGIEAGRPRRIRITDLFEQVDELGHYEPEWTRTESAPAELPPVTTAVVAVGVGHGVARLLRGLGVQVVVAGGQSMNPSTAQLADAVSECNAAAVIVLPNNKNIIAVSEQVDDVSEKNVVVVPTTAVVEGLAALVVYDPQADVAANTAAMIAAANSVRSGEVTKAVRDSHAECGPIAEGQWIGVERHGIHVVAETALGALMGLLQRLITDDTEIVTVVTGREAETADVRRIEEHLAEHWPDIEIEVHEGDQPLYPYLVGVE